ncbi:uncharacterized protein AB675_11803 [Cyphellophora attinorum]|uniref:Uncharacterized protein n=1 Tax=Cyphellophora attinorum TaxID=1664694 RepID=A0A0N0NJC4_9EURO|nr:uncharacterized protein AB675_11803 [Phialophora attinorum]KPI36821.1 hypothetical protein AB675_11803 [Phialophora attinorum]
MPADIEVRPITPLEVAQAKQQYPQLQNRSDDEVRQMLFNRRQTQAQQAAAARQNLQGQQQPGQQPQQPQRQVPQQQKPQPTTQPQTQPNSRPQSQTQDRAAQQGGNDANKAVQPPQQMQGQKSSMPTVTPEQWAKMTPQQQQGWAKMRQRHAATAKIQAFSQQIAERLGSDSAKAMMHRMDSFLLAYHEILGNTNDDELKKVVRMRTLLFRQYHPASVADKTFVPNPANFNVTPEEVSGMLSELQIKFAQTAASIPRPPGQQQPTAGQLTSENLKQLENQEQGRKQSVGGTKNRDGPPPAPTDAQAPFSFSGERGHGAPKYAAPGLKQEDLKLPIDPKRRKKGAPATPVSATTPAQTTASQSMVPQAAQQQKTAATQQTTPASTFNCSFITCDRHAKGFQSKAELDQHVAMVHSMADVKDPLAFLDESLQEAFNLDANFKQIKKPQAQSIGPAIGAQPMKRSASALLNAKIESRPATPSAMARVPSAAGSIGETIPAGKPEGEEDPWQHSNIQPAQINDIFGDVEWEYIVPAADSTVHDKFMEGAVPKEGTSTPEAAVDGQMQRDKKSVSPPTDGKDASPKAADSDEDSFLVDLSGVPGLDLSDWDALNGPSAEHSLTSTSILSDSDGDFEMVDAPNTSAAAPTGNKPTSIMTVQFNDNDAAFLRQLGIDPDKPYEDIKNQDQREFYDFLAKPIREKRFMEQAVEEFEVEFREWEMLEKQKGGEK